MQKYQISGPARFDHQRRGLQKLIDTKGRAALLFDPGLGKTAVVLDYAGLLALKSATGEARVLVVCPLVAVDTWVIEAQKFLSPMVSYWAEALGGGIKQKAEALASRGGRPHGRPLTERTKRSAKEAPRALHRERAVMLATSPAGVTDPDRLPNPRVIIAVVNLDIFASRAARGASTMADVMVDAVKRFNPDLLVIDESHTIKSASGNASRALGRAARYVKRRVLLTGTVMPHSPLDVFAQWRALEPTAFGTAGSEATQGDFKMRYAILGGWMGEEVVGFRNLDEMQDIMARNAVVAKKEEALDLPPTTEVVIPVELSPEEKRVYAEMKSVLVAQLDSGAQVSTSNRLAQMMRLRQITSGHVPDDAGNLTRIGDSKVNTIRSLVNTTLAGESRVVVFCVFSQEIQQLAVALAEKGTTIELITGDTSTSERQLIRKRFGSDDPGRVILIAQIKAVSMAINELVTASHAVFGSMSQQRGDFVQAKARLDRQGQTKPVTFWLCLAPKTVDEVILAAHRGRADLEAAMLQHIRSTD